MLMELQLGHWPLVSCSTPEQNHFTSEINFTKSSITPMKPFILMVFISRTWYRVLQRLTYLFGQSQMRGNMFMQSEFGRFREPERIILWHLENPSVWLSLRQIIS